MPRSSFQKYISGKVSDIDTCLAINTIAHIMSPAPPPTPPPPKICYDCHCDSDGDGTS